MSQDTPPLWKQVAGAVVGGTLALGLYYGYEYAKPHVSSLTAYVTLPGGDDVERKYDPGIARVNDSSLEADELKRFASRNRQAADRALAASDDVNTDYLETDDVNPFEVDWPTYQKMEAEEAVEDEPVGIEWPEDADAMEYEEAEDDPWEDFPWDDETNDWDADAMEYEEEEVVSVNAETLPSSGVETWILGFAALMGAGYVRYRKELAAVLS